MVYFLFRIFLGKISMIFTKKPVILLIWQQSVTHLIFYMIRAKVSGKLQVYIMVPWESGITEFHKSNEIGTIMSIFVY